jgi:hypothetical protein
METINLQVESGGGDGKGFARISLNGRELRVVNYGRGLNVAVLDENTGEMISFACFDTFAKECGDYFAEFIENLPNGRIVAIAVKDTAVGVETNSLSDKAIATCKSLGSKEIDKLGMRDTWALIAKKGEPNAAKEALAKATLKNNDLFPETPVTAKSDLNVSGKPSNGLVIAVTSGGYNNVDSSASITIDGRDALTSGYQDGINVVVFDGDNSKPLSTHVYTPGQADEFAKLIEELPENRIVALTVKGDGKGILNDHGKTACKGLGSRLVDKLEQYGSWTLIAQKGKPGFAIENLKNTGVAKDLSGKPVPVAVSWRLPAPTQTPLPITEPVEPEGKVQPQKVQLSDLRVDCYSNWWSTSKSVAVQGKVALVGAPLSEVGNVVNAGAVYVMEYQDGQWKEKQKLLHPEPVYYDLFGLSVDFDGDLAIVGAPNTANNVKPGAAYIFQRQNGKWQLMQKLQGPKDFSGYKTWGYAYDSFGYSVAISGKLAIVGAPFSETLDPYRANAGVAHIFQLENGTWQFKQTLVPDDLRGGDLFGGSVDIDGDVAIAGGFYVHNSSNVQTGGAYIFQLQNGQWQQVQKLQPDDLKYCDWFGAPLALSGDLAIVGAYGTDRPSVAGDVGAAYIFQKLQNGKWQLMQKLQPDDLKAVDCFGTSVAISGKVAVVGAMWVDVPAVNAGAAYIFQLENGKWQLKQKVQPEKLAYYEWFGHSVAVDGEIALVRGNKQHEAGAGDEAGAVYFFDTTA